MKGGDRPTGGVANGMSWGHPTKGRPRAAGAVAVLGLLATAAVAPPSSAAEGPPVPVIVQEAPNSGSRPEALVQSVGGTVDRPLAIIGGFAATVPAGAMDDLRASPDLLAVTRDASVRLLDEEDLLEESPELDPSHDDGSMYTLVKRVTRAAKFWRAGYNGTGIDVALIDSGVVPVDGLTAPGKVINGADLSFESQSNQLRYLDTFGHGTHMAGIIAGRDDGVTSMYGPDRDRFMGMAPGARVVSVKVADVNGATDVSQVIAAIDWVVQHRHDNGMNIRVLNLSFGTDGVQDYRLDPLAHAAEVAWRKGIVVVVAAGNASYGSGRLNNPAYDPYVLAVGAADGDGTYTKHDDEVPDFSSCGNAGRRPDLVAPGQSVISLRDPGSRIDVDHPGGRVGERFFRGSGTSQAAAIVSGAAALLLDQRPWLSPDQVKGVLTSSAAPIPYGDLMCQGAGMLDLKQALWTGVPFGSTQLWPPSSGLGSLEAARGSAHLTDGETELRGEIDIFGHPWDGKSWSAASMAGASWKGGAWNGKSWSGDSWSATSWAGKSWSGVTWDGKSWSGKSWSEASWDGKSWSGKSWSIGSWSGKSWSGKSWGSEAWSTTAWGDGY
jgi:Subtilase family